MQLESFQYSKPVIASNIGSLPELVLDGVNGYLFKPADVRELCEKVALLDDDAVVEKMGAASRARLVDDGSTDGSYVFEDLYADKC